LVALLRIGDYLLNAHMPLDLLGFSEVVSPGSLATSMSPMTALGVMLIGFALGLGRASRPSIVFQALIIAAALLGCLGFSRYIFGGEPLLPFGAMAAHTAIGILVLSVGALSMRPERGLVRLLMADTTGGTLARSLIAPVLLVPPVVGWLSLRGQQAGYFGAEAGIALFALTNVMLLGALVWRTAWLLDRMSMRRRQGEETRRRYLAIVQGSADAIAGKTLDGVITNWNPAAERMFGYSAAEAIGQPVTMLFPPEIRGEESEIRARLIRGERLEAFETIRIRKDGTPLSVSVSISPIRDDRDCVIGASTIIRDLTERQKAQELVRRADAKLHQLLMHSPALIYTLKLDADGIAPVVVSDNIERLFGYRVTEATTYEWWLSILHPDDRDRVAQTVAEKLPTGGYTIEYRVRHADGTYHWIEDSNRTLTDQTGRASESVGVWIDITARKEAHNSLNESEQRFRELAENIHEVFWMVEAQTQTMLYVSPAYEKIWGRSCEELMAAPNAWMDAIHPEDRKSVQRAAETKQNNGTYDEEYRIIRPDGSERWVHDRAVPVQRPDGTVVRIVGVAEDITDRRSLELQYRQAQKMEAVGQLAGGVAHDFNNILTVIHGHASLMAKNEETPPTNQASISEIVTASDRAARLTRQLLAFSSRQTLVPRDLDLNEIVGHLVKMLQRVLGDDIRIELNLASTPLIVHADRGMLEQILLNLAVNARDAMPKGGVLAIESIATDFDEHTAAHIPEVRAGTFACLNVSDTGTGIPKDILPRIFEPFFSTKEVGKGTGLGLATVFGIVKQHAGWIRVYSEIKTGTTFRVYLPRLVKQVAAPIPQAKPVQARGGTETILLAEDDPALRSMVRAVLGDLGYHVLEAASGQAALQTWRQHRKAIRLLLTDLVMPDGVSGTDLARQLLLEEPRLPVIYTSGYSRQIAGKHLELHEGVNYLAKPFALDQLTELVRNALDAASPADGDAHGDAGRSAA
jgi:PAS domain S-box-containing protein